MKLPNAAAELYTIWAIGTRILKIFQNPRRKIGGTLCE